MGDFFFFHYESDFNCAIMETRKELKVSMDKQTILKTSEQLFLEKGLKFTLDDVASTLHCAKKTIYKFYESKEDLLNDMLDNAYLKIYASKDEIINSDLPYEEKLKHAMIAMPDYYQVFDFRALDDLGEKYPKVYQNLTNKLETNWEPIIALLKEGQDKGIVNDINISVLRTIVTSTINAFVTSDVLNDSELTYQQGLDEMMTIILKGILK